MRDEDSDFGDCDGDCENCEHAIDFGDLEGVVMFVFVPDCSSCDPEEQEEIDEMFKEIVSAEFGESL